MRNLKHRTKLFVIFIITGLIPIWLANVVSFMSGYEGMKEVSNQLLSDKLVENISVFQVYTNQFFGSLELKNEELIDQKGQSIEGQYEMIDKLSDDLNIVATIFVKRNNQFVRVNTSIVDESGKRVEGTVLDNQEVLEAVNGGQRYIGEADILGKDYLTVYEPLLNNENKMIGILFTGVSKEQSQQMIASNILKTQVASGTVLVIAIMFGIIVIILSAKAIVAPLEQVVMVANIIAQYNLSEDISEKLTNRKDEIGTVARALKAIQDNLREMIRDVGNVSKNVTTTSNELANNCQEANQVTEEMAKTIQEVAQGATDQATSTTECIQRLDTLGALIDSNQGEMVQLNTAASEVNEMTKVGQQVLKDLVRKIKESNMATIEAYESMMQTNESAIQISAASNMIASIAEQTNLLALNASIEAARAGEYGRGFAVVAEEIRKLAEQSAQSTGQIDEQIKKLQKDASTAVVITERVKNMLNEQTQDVMVTENKYDEIAKAIAVTDNSVEQLNQSSLQMQEEKVQVSSYIEALSAVAQENAAATEQASACIEEQSAAIHDMHSSSATLAEMATNLQNMIMKFKL